MPRGDSAESTFILPHLVTLRRMITLEIAMESILVSRGVPVAFRRLIYAVFKYNAHNKYICIDTE